LNVEGWRLIESAHGVIKQDVGVFEEPGRYEQGDGNAGQFHIGCHDEQEGEDHDDRRGPTARGSEEMMQEFQVPGFCMSRKGTHLIGHENSTSKAHYPDSHMCSYHSCRDDFVRQGRS